MIKKILNNLAKPHKIPQKILSKLIFYKKKKNYNQIQLEKEQGKIFSQLNFDRSLGLSKLSELKKEYNILNRPMSSEHEVIFASLSLISNKNYEKILEIGTYDGINSFLLSLLFKNSKIKTIDLKSSEENFKNFYSRKNNLAEFIKRRDEIINKNKNIFFEEMNSINLINSNEKFDLIWIDGAHGYPVVCIDIINSLKLINDGGVIICDDIIINKNLNQDQMYNSIASFETLSEFQKEKIIEFKLIYKRLDSDNNCDPKKRKFIAVINKIKN